MTTLRDWSDSAALYDVARAHLPGGVNSNVRLAAPKLYFQRGSGAWLWDVDGNNYIDYVLGQGPSFFGHANKRVNETVAAACADGLLFGGQNPLEVQAAEAMLLALEWPDMIRFGMTGTESVQAALRVARAATGRTKIVRFEGHYHGWMDNILIAMHDGVPVPASEGQVARSLQDSIVLPWNDIQGLRACIASSGSEIAAVIMEPVMLNAGAIEPHDSYLKAVREECTRHGIVLIFDEVITGFRIARSGAAGRYGVTPDLAVYGKAMAGGWPVAALAGRRDIMELFGDGRVNHSGTFNGSVMAAAAVLVAQELLDEDPPYERIEAYGVRLSTELVNLARSHGIPLRSQGLGAAFHLSFGAATPVRDFRELSMLDLDRYAGFAWTLARFGLWVAPRGAWYISTSHAQDELDETISRFDAALRYVVSTGQFDGRPGRDLQEGR